MKNKEKEFHGFPIFKKKQVVVCDETHVVGIGFSDSLKPSILKNDYGTIAFNFGYLEHARSFFESLLGKNFDVYDVECYIPKTKNAPVIFMYNANTLYTSNKKKKLFYAIAPMIRDQNE